MISHVPVSKCSRALFRIHPERLNIWTAGAWQQGLPPPLCTCTEDIWMRHPRIYDYSKYNLLHAGMTPRILAVHIYNRGQIFVTSHECWSHCGDTGGLKEARENSEISKSLISSTEQRGYLQQDLDQHWTAPRGADIQLVSTAALAWLTHFVK